MEQWDRCFSDSGEERVTTETACLRCRFPQLGPEPVAMTTALIPAPLALESAWFIDIIPIPACSRMRCRGACTCACCSTCVLQHLARLKINMLRGTRCDGLNVHNKHKALCTGCNDFFLFHVILLLRKETCKEHFKMYVSWNVSNTRAFLSSTKVQTIRWLLEVFLWSFVDF